MSTTTRKYEVIGTRPIRHDGTDKVTGRAIYGADFKITGQLTGKILRSPHAHARIISIDTRRAEALPGVKAVVTGKDLPSLSDKMADLGESTENLKYLSNNVLAGEKALYKGHAIAAVAAADAHTAEEALSLIDVQYEVLPPVLDVREAMKDGAPILLESLRTDSMGKRSKKPTNVAKYEQYLLGDVDDGFAGADVVIEREFHTATVHQGYIEPQVATALWNADGAITIWTANQGAFGVRRQVAEILQVPVSKIKVVPLEIGGGFGGKINVYLEPVAALLSKKAGRPVKMQMSRAEVFEGTGPTPGTYIKLKLGVKKDGRLVAAQAYLAYEAGAFPGSAVTAGAKCLLAMYDIPNCRIDAYDVVVNKPKSSAYRAPGSTQAAFATETIVDELCERLNMDPLEFRLKNAAHEGTRRADGPVYPRIGYVETLQAAKAHPHYSAPLAGSGPYRGRGVATGFWFNGGGTSSCTIAVNSDGTISLVEGSTDIGGTRASIAMQAAEVLGLPATAVRPTVGDTDSVGHTDVTGGSRVTFATGWAAFKTAEKIRDLMKERAASIWETTVDNVGFEKGTFFNANDRSMAMSFKQLADQLPKTGGPISASVTVDTTGVGGAFATMIVDVQVDPETGKVDITRCTICQDAGTAIHPSYVEGQMQGGVVQGIGWALNEEYFFTPDGRMANSSFLDYRMPTALDLPMIDTVIVEVPNPGHPFGVRGVGEVPIVPPPAALANAIYRAVGVRMRTLPMSPGKIVAALQAKRGNGKKNGGGNGRKG